MHTDKYSNPIFTEQDLFDAIYRGYQFSTNDTMIVERTDAGDGFLTTPPGLVINSLSKTDAISGGAANAYGITVLTQNTRDNVKMIEATSFDGGVTVYLKYIGEF